MELADRGYILDPAGPVSPDNWPSPYEPARAEADAPAICAAS
jgi:N-formylglutamate deformylase